MKINTILAPVNTFSCQVLAIICIGGIILWIAVAIIFYRSVFILADEDNHLFSLKSPEQEIELCKLRTQELSPGFWRRVNLHKLKIPESVKSVSRTVVQSDVIVQGVKVHYIYAKPKENSSIPVLLLHGQAYTSETWNKLGTITLLSALGYYPIAVDLPGFGKTPSIQNLNKVYFLDDLISVLNLQKPVVVSPSMSGSFSLPYLVEHSKKLGGFIAVSPVRTSILNDAHCKDEEDNTIDLPKDCMNIMHYLESDKPKLNCIKVPSLIVWGERDKNKNSAKLCLLPESQGAEIPEGKHAAYLSNPELWHKLLYNFLNILNMTQACW